MLPIGVHGIGIGLTFPTLTLLLLDRFPRHRGAVSSVQAFVSLLASAGIAGVVSPWVSHSVLGLAATAAVVTVLGYLAWRASLRFDGLPPPRELV